MAFHWDLFYISIYQVRNILETSVCKCGIFVSVAAYEMKKLRGTRTKVFLCHAAGQHVPEESLVCTTCPECKQKRQVDSIPWCGSPCKAGRFNDYTSLAWCTGQESASLCIACHMLFLLFLHVRHEGVWGQQKVDWEYSGNQNREGEGQLRDHSRNCTRQSRELAAFPALL